MLVDFCLFLRPSWRNMYVAVIGWLKKVELVERLCVHHYYYTLFHFKVSYYGLCILSVTTNWNGKSPSILYLETKYTLNLFEKHYNSIILHFRIRRSGLNRQIWTIVCTMIVIVKVHWQYHAHHVQVPQHGVIASNHFSKYILWLPHCLDYMHLVWWWNEENVLIVQERCLRFVDHHHDQKWSISRGKLFQL